MIEMFLGEESSMCVLGILDLDLDCEFYQELKDLADIGISTKEISERFNVPKYIVEDILKRVNYEL
jgi:hypothetical protein